MGIQLLFWTKLLILGLFQFYLAEAEIELQDAHTPGVEFIPASTPDSYTTINFDELNKPTEVTLALLHNTEGDANYTIINQSGSRYFANLNINVQENPDKGTILTANTIDFEILDKPSFTIFISDAQRPDNKARILLTIVNLDDEYPQLSIDRCNMEENNITATCDVKLHDPDGFLDQMTFKITDLNPDDRKDLFKIDDPKEGKPGPDVKDATFLLTLTDELDYESVVLYSFKITVTDSGSNEDSIPAIVNVIDMPDMPPFWTNFVSTRKIVEESPTSFEVKAIDGDFMIAAVINYKLKEPNEFVTIDKDSGIISIEAIDRDGDDGHDQVTFTVIAYEKDDPTSHTEEKDSLITLLIEDIDDNIPAFNGEKVIEINAPEGSVKEIESKVFTVRDIDTGENAIFSLDIQNDVFKDNFNLVPNKGYESVDISIIVKDSSKLDFEDEVWRSITFDIVSKGTKNESKTDQITINIELEDWNDEWPIFSPTDYTAEVREDILANEEINIVPSEIKATDRDAEDKDKVKHEIIGSLQKLLKIEDFGGKITTIQDDVFDYEKQTEVFVQIQASDKGGHKAIAQLTITVLDVNDENPKFQTVQAIKIEENLKDDTPLDVNIQATDVDTNCSLVFSIDWDKSRAVKNLQEYTKFNTEYKGFLTFDTEKIDDHTFKGNLKINDVVKDNTPDFEKFDTVYLSIKVYDEYTEKGTGIDEAIITINIINLNDNDPVFTEETNKMNYTVVENSLEGIIIGVVLATDADNLEPLIYTIKPKSKADEGLVTINEATGQLQTTNSVIDCDDPPREYISYTVTASDTERETEKDIEIYIIDLNDNNPMLDGSSTSIEEDFYGKPSTHNNAVLFTLNVEDKDRSAEYNAETVVCRIANTDPIQDPIIQGRFKVDNKNKLIVDLQEDIILDREFQEVYSMTVQCQDNPSGKGGTQNSILTPPQFTVTLEDVNDWTPTIKSPEKIQTNENLKKDQLLDTEIVAEDKDLDNAGLVKFSIISIKCSSSSICQKEDIDDLFSTKEIGERNKIKLQAGKDLRGYFGLYDVDIKVEDSAPKSLSSSSVVTVEVQKYNFELPSFDSSLHDLYYLDPTQKIGSTLVQSNGDPFPAIIATDNQDDKYHFTYTVDKNDFFEIHSKDNSQADLTWIGPTPATGSVEIKLTATIKDGSNIPGEKEYTAEKSIKITFLSIKDTDPEFPPPNTAVWSVKENTDEPVFNIPQAEYINITNDLPLEKYYLLKDQSDFFNVDINNGNISLKVPLDYEEIKVHELKIYASNKQSIKPMPNENSILTVTINVEDVNDNPPIFEHDVYNATVTVGSSAKTSIIQVKATDIDTVGSILTYTITDVIPPESIKASGPYFTMEPTSGQITVVFLVTDDMSGFFEISIRATDQPPEQNTGDALVKVHIVNKENTVNFKFENPSDTVAKKLSNIETTLTSYFSYATHAESPSRDTTPNKENVDRTLVPIYFIDEITNTPVLATEILKKITSAQTFANLKNSFLEDSLILMSFESTGGNETNTNEMLKAWLIGVTVLLGGLIIVLIVAFVLRNRSLTNRIKNLSSTKFGSQESGLNRLGLATIPTANKNAVEGANPVYNKNREEEDENVREVDQESIASGDSDLIGVEDNPEFDSREEAPSHLKY